MKFGVVTFPGSNCDHDMIYVLETVMGFEVEHLWHKDHDLKGADFVVLPGGFSYGDYLRSGAIARFSPIMNEVVAHAKKGGYVMGICNGFQIVCESGLLTGTLQHNNSQLFVCKNAFLKTENDNTLITNQLQKGQVLKVPVAHAEGRYFDHPDAIKQLEDNGQVLFRYCDENGVVNESTNLNGSVNNIAGVVNGQGNVFGMMPHPERAADSNLRNLDGKQIFDSILSQVTA